jgi:hypothetical protein
VPTLDAIAEHPELARTLPPAARAAVLTRCAGVLSALAVTDILAPIMSPPASADRLVDVAEAARRLAVSKDYVYRHAGEWPFTVRRGRKLGFSEQGIATYLQNVQQQALAK